MKTIEDLVKAANIARFITHNLDAEIACREEIESRYGKIDRINQFNSSEELVMYYCTGWGDSNHVSLASVHPDMASFNKKGECVIHEHKLFSALVGVAVKDTSESSNTLSDYAEIERRVLSMIPESLIEEYDGTNAEKIVQYINDHLLSE